MSRQKSWRKAVATILTVVCMAGNMVIPAFAVLDGQAYANEYFTMSKIPTGKTGKTISITVKFKNAAGTDLHNVKIGFDPNVNWEIPSDIEDPVADTYTYPFEVTDGMFDKKSVGSVREDNTKSVTLSARIRRDIPEGYYAIPIEFEADESRGSEYVNIWITKSTSSTDDTEEAVKDVAFAIGEGQSTPYGVYPDVMNFELNLRNRGKITAQDVTASLVMSKDSKEYPFDINDANYDLHFDRIGYDETVVLGYSMAIRKDVYTGFYPIKMNITYRESSDGALLTAEEEFYVHVVNKDTEEETRDFNANDRTKARIIVDSFKTIPEEIYAGEEFELVLNMKNASSGITASNILLSFESEKVSDSAVFTTESGAGSMVIDSLGGGSTKELRIKMSSRAGVDQRSYAITVNEQYDSPEFKNAEGKVVVDIPVKQHARLNTGTIEVAPESITVGSETNVMFGINNTGKVLLYNVTARFEGDSIQGTDSYVGNIKPGDTGNVDVMISGKNPTTDDGKVKIIISYEDENGTESTMEKEMTLLVTPEETMMDESMENVDLEAMAPDHTSYFARYIKWGIGGAVLLVVVAVTATLRKRKKRKAAEKEIDDEIS